MPAGPSTTPGIQQDVMDAAAAEGELQLEAVNKAGELCSDVIDKFAGRLLTKNVAVSHLMRVLNTVPNLGEREKL